MCFYGIFAFLYFQEESTVTESSRPPTAQSQANVDPLALDVEDLYVKFKVSKKAQHVSLHSLLFISLSFLLYPIFRGVNALENDSASP